MDIVLINPLFDVSYWGLELAMPLIRRRAAMPPAALPLLAALTPREHQVTILDENTGELDWQRLDRADLVAVTGMIPQRRRMLEILVELKRRGAFTAVGGPWATVEESDFEDLVDVVFVGEADTTWPVFLEEWVAGKPSARYEQEDFTDLTTLPVPRWDLLNMGHYLLGSLQLSRGCPYDCEFCDIPAMFGRKTRVKSVNQVGAELDALRQHGVEMAFLVDDNILGNRREMKPLLRAMAAWQNEQGYPLVLTAEGSLDLAERDDLTDCMLEANILSVFVGLESPEEDSLREAHKVQNLADHRGDMVSRVRHLQDKGFDVWCGLIVGFDADDETIFDKQRQLIAETRIQHAMVGMLSAIPKTPLYHRLKAAGRLAEEGASEWGTNVVPVGMTRERLRQGYLDLSVSLYEPDAFFDRFERQFLKDPKVYGVARARHWRTHPLVGLRRLSACLWRSLGLFLMLNSRIPEPALRREYRRRLGRFLRYHRDPFVLQLFLIKCLFHYHHYTLTRTMASGEQPVVNTY